MSFFLDVELGWVANQSTKLKIVRIFSESPFDILEFRLSSNIKPSRSFKIHLSKFEFNTESTTLRFILFECDLATFDFRTSSNINFLFHI